MSYNRETEEQIKDRRNDLIIEILCLVVRTSEDITVVVRDMDPLSSVPTYQELEGSLRTLRLRIQIKQGGRIDIPTNLTKKKNHRGRSWTGS